jgi:hypothetical protein
VTRLLPRLSSHDARLCMSRFIRLDITEIASQADAGLDTLPVTFASTGGARFEPDQLRLLRSDVRTLAQQSGYPAEVGRDAQQRFDRETSLYLRTFPGLETGEAIRAETWQFVAAGLLPDIVFWRFAREGTGYGVTEARYVGGNRNCFGRLWQRAVVFWDDRISEPDFTLKLLKEDNFTAILERSAFSAFPAPCREAARAFLLRRPLARDRAGKSLEEQLLRDAMCRVVRTTGYVALWALEDAQLQAHMAGAFDLSLKAMGVEPLAESDLVARQSSLRLIGTRVGATTVLSPTPTPARQARNEPVRPFTPTVAATVSKRPPPFEEMAPGDQTSTVWRILIGRGEASEEELVRVAALALKDHGQLSFERLREGGGIYREVKDAIEHGVRTGRFDKPARGSRRAIVVTADELPLPVVDSIIRNRIATGLPADDALPLLVSEVCQLTGTGDRTGVRRLVDASLTAMLARGEVVVADGAILPRPAV